MFSLFLLLCLLPLSIYCQMPLSSFSKQGVVPDVIPDTPQKALQVEYANGHKANFGNELTPSDVKHEPNIQWEAEDGQLYTIIMTDPDAPSRTNPIRREFKHWVVVNIPGADISRGDVAAEYVGAGPPKDTGLHRYVILLYKQNGQVDAGFKTSKHTADHRAKWSANKFAVGHGMRLVAANFFQAQYDDYVPTVHKQLSGGK